MFNPCPKQQNKVSKKLTDASNGKDCIRCHGDDAYACHYNGDLQHIFGKGRGIKCSDIATADFCHRCDQKYAEGQNTGFRDAIERNEKWLKWVTLTNIRRFNDEVLKV